jgi:hypothetical protein
LRPHNLKVVAVPITIVLVSRGGGISAAKDWLETIERSKPRIIAQIREPAIDGSVMARDARFAGALLTSTFGATALRILGAATKMISQADRRC